MEISKAKIGFRYKFECLDAQGRPKWEFEQDNLIPDGGIEYILAAAVMGGAQFSNWYIGLYEGAYAPQAADTMANFIAAATETQTYTETTRPVLVPDVLSGGIFINGNEPAIFTFNANKTLRGGFIASNPVKGGQTGILLSAVLAPSPKPVESGDQLRVTAGLALITV